MGCTVMEHLGVWEIWESMGFLARGVFFLLVALSVFSLTVSFERHLVFRQARRQSLKFAELASLYLKQDRPEAAIEAAKRFGHSHLAKVIAAGLLKFQSKQGSTHTGPEVVEAARHAIDRAMLTTTAGLKRGISGLATVASVAPFIGLFGTILGIINAFAEIARMGSGGIGAVSAGIAEALVITAVGLGVAIPAVALFNHFSAGIERFQMEMASASSELLDFFIEKHSATHALD
jgi:biopolymer transport protein ExbB/biopolymer transport protein TolQ